MNDDTPPTEDEEPVLPQGLHQELGRRRVRVWWVVLGLLLSALALMYFAQRLRRMQEGGTPPDRQASNLSGFSPISPEIQFAPCRMKLRAPLI